MFIHLEITESAAKRLVAWNTHFFFTEEQDTDNINQQQQDMLEHTL